MEEFDVFGQLVNSVSGLPISGVDIDVHIKDCQGREIKVGTALVRSNGRFSVAVRTAISLGTIIRFLFKVKRNNKVVATTKVHQKKKQIRIKVKPEVKFHLPNPPFRESDSNVVKAKGLLDGLFKPNSGAQKEYKPDPSLSNNQRTVVNILTAFDRVWVYSQGIALDQAARRYNLANAEDQDYYLYRSIQLITWIIDTHVDELPVNNLPVRGWNFSQNTKVIVDPDTLEAHLADEFKDPRLVTGANAWALNGVAQFIASQLFQLLPPDRQQFFREFYWKMLDGLLVHQRESDGLCSAGWDYRILQNPNEDVHYIRKHIQDDVPFIKNALNNFKIDPEDPLHIRDKQKIQDLLIDPQQLEVLMETDLNESDIRNLFIAENVKGRSYNKILGIAGYPDKRVMHNGDPRPWYDRVPADMRARVQARNVVTEHNIDVLAVLNFALEHAMSLGFSDDKRMELIDRRCKLRNAIFTKLYDSVKERIITGRTPEDIPSAHTAIDNASWLALFANLSCPDCFGIREIHRDRLANGLLYTIENFTKDIEFDSQHYFGAHYFESNFEDPYIERAPAGSQERVYHIEATTGLILGLKEFKNAYPEHPYSRYFTFISDKLWSDVQRFVHENGFIYGTVSIQDLFEPLESSTTATWYIDTHDQFVADPIKELNFVNKPDKPPQSESVKVLYDDYLHFPVKRWGSAAEELGSTVSLNGLSAGGYQGAQALEISFNEEGGQLPWGGITLVYLGNWRSKGQLGANISHANRLIFYAKASRDNMKVELGIGSEQGQTTSDSGFLRRDFILSQTWDEYQLSFDPTKFSDINELLIVGFKSHSLGSGWGSGTIWLDGIQFLPVPSFIPSQPQEGVETTVTA